jgi:hypothetical protein
MAAKTIVMLVGDDVEDDEVRQLLAVLGNRIEA